MGLRTSLARKSAVMRRPEPATAGNAAIIPDFNKKINTISVYCYKKALDICITLC